MITFIIGFHMHNDFTHGRPIDLDLCPYVLRDYVGPIHSVLRVDFDINIYMGIWTG